MRRDLTLFVLALTWQMVIGDDPCLPLSQCPQMMAMLESQEGVPFITKNDVFDQLRQLGCGFSGREPLVLCSPMIEASEEDDDYTGDVARFSLGTRNEVDTCTGHLIFIHSNRNSNRQRLLNSMQTTSLRRARYFNLERRILKPLRILLNVKSFGNCCWNLYSEKNHDGTVFNVGLGFIGLPEFTPKSVKRVTCD